MAEQKKNTTSQNRSSNDRGRSSGGNRRGGGGRDRRRGGRRRQSEPREFEQKILDLSRVTRVTAGGKRMSFRTALVIGDKKGRVALGVAKGADVQISIEKAYRQAKKRLVEVPLVNETIPHAITMKFGSAEVLLKPAPMGTGLKSGGAIRMVLELAGVPNAVSKILNSNNKINIARATIEAIRALEMPVETTKTSEKKEQKSKEEKTDKKPAAKKAAAKRSSKKATAKA